MSEAHHFRAYAPRAADAGGYCPQQPQQQQQRPHAPVLTAPTHRDVLNGRGQGVQRHPGNVKYRTLVFVNKGLYAKCPRSDKIKISKGIVAAVRELGGRFLEIDERTGLCRDIGDKKATEKTSQALREGQTKIRKQMYDDEKRGGGAQQHVTSLIASAHATTAVPNGGGREISTEGYFGYSVQVLESLYLEDEGVLHVPQQPATARPPVAPVAPPPVPSNPATFAPAPSSGDANAAAIARALEQFPGAAAAMMAAAPATAAAPPPVAPPPPAAGVDPTRREELRPSLGRFTNELASRPSLGRFTNELASRPSLGRFTGTSMSSALSLAQMLDSARRTMDSRESALSGEIRDLIRRSEPQLVQVENMNIDDDPTHEDKEVSFGEDTMKDRVSELRFTDLSRDIDDPNRRSIDSTDSARYSGTSLMDASMMTIGSCDMSVLSGAEKRRRRSTKGDRETADLLLSLSGESAKI